MTFHWPPESIGILKARATEGASASQIAAEIGGGVTRNAILGKAYRIGVSLRNRTADTPEAEAYFQARETLRRERIRAAARREREKRHVVRSPVALPPKPLPPPSIDDAAIPLEQRRTILELDNCHCHWPVGEPGDDSFFFCGSPTADVLAGRSYCPAHHHRSISHQVVSDAERARRRDWGFILAQKAAQRRAAK